MAQRKWWNWVVAAGLLAAWGVAIAQDAGEPPARGRRGRDRAADADARRRERAKRDLARRRRAALGRYRAMIEAVRLTDEQKKQLAELAARQQKEMEAIQAKHRQQILDLLTPEQREAWLTARKVQPVLRRFARAGLTDEQKARIGQLVKQADLPASARSREAYQAYAKLYEQIVQKVLTLEQREEWLFEQRLRMVMGRLGRIGLTDQQTEAIKEIVKQAKLPDSPRTREAYQAYRKLQQEIVNNVLTPEQRAKLETLRGERRGRGARRPAREGRGADRT